MTGKKERAYSTNTGSLRRALALISPCASPPKATSTANWRRRGANNKVSRSQMPPVRAQAITRKAGKSKFMSRIRISKGMG